MIKYIISLVIISIFFLVYFFLFDNNKDIDEYNNKILFKSDNEHQFSQMLIDNLNSILNEGYDSNFLLIEIDDFFIQFAVNKKDKIIYFEAVSNLLLKHGNNINKFDRYFIQLGFTMPNEKNCFLNQPIQNYSKCFKIINDSDIENIAKISYTIFRDIYNLDNKLIKIKKVFQ